LYNLPLSLASSSGIFNKNHKQNGYVNVTGIICITSLTSIIGTRFNPNFADFAGIFLKCGYKLFKYLIINSMSCQII
jgi:hypothetical protein